MAELITVEQKGRVGLITLNRPKQLNALNPQLMQELGAALQAFDADEGVGAMVITGSEKAFAAGADIGVMKDYSYMDAFMANYITRDWEHLRSIRKPVIAAVNGHAIGIGMTLAMQCDLRLMATGSKYGFVHVRRGVIPDAHSHWTVPRAVGFTHALDLLMTGRHFTAEEAVAMGLANRALPAEVVLQAAQDIAEDIAVNTAPLSVAISKRLLWHDPPLTADEADRLETAMHEVVMGTADAKEGVLAFLERRRPTWTLSPTKDWPDL